jgi:DNA-binding protein
VSTWTKKNGIDLNQKTKGVKKMTEETTPKPVAEKTEETKPVGEEQKKATKPMEKKPDVIFIGNKPPMSYVMAIITAMSAGDISEIMLKARGKAITTAVDVAEITTNRFLKDLRVTAIGIGTEEMPPREGDSRTRNVSTMEIKLTKK